MTQCDPPLKNPGYAHVAVVAVVVVVAVVRGDNLVSTLCMAHCDPP